MRIIARLNVGGPAIHVALLTHRLSAPEYESVLVAGRVGEDEGDMSYYAESLGVTPRIIPELGRSLHPVRDLKVIWQVYRLIREFKPDLVHTHTAKAGFVGRIAAWLAGVPVIVHTYHGHVFRGYFSPTMTRVFLGLERLTARMSSTVITLTEGLKGEIADQFRVTTRDKIVVMGLGLDLGRFAATSRKQGNFRAAHGIPADAPLIGIVGRLVPVKNHALFLEAAALVRRDVPDARFVIVGDGETRAEVEAKIAELGLGDDAVQITGWTRDLTPVYSDLDVMALSSVNEGTPVTIIEALAAGCAVASTAVGGVPDLLEGGKLGALAESGNAESLAAAMLDALKRGGDAATRALVVERYGVDRLVRDIDALYKRLLAAKTQRRKDKV